MVDAELAFQARLRRLPSRELHHEWMDLQLDVIDRSRRQLVFIAELDAAVDSGMHHHTACKRLICIVGNLECLAELVRDVTVIVTGTDGIDPAVFRFETLFRACETLRREDRRRQTILCGASGMETLGHGAEHVLETYRLLGR